jgi:hypothetical protein
MAETAFDDCEQAGLGTQGDDMITIKIVMLVMLVAAIVASAYATDRSKTAEQPQT